MAFTEVVLQSPKSCGSYCFIHASVVEASRIVHREARDGSVNSPRRLRAGDVTYATDINNEQ